jgi:hypothetical protein
MREKQTRIETGAFPVPSKHWLSTNRHSIAHSKQSIRCYHIEATL